MNGTEMVESSPSFRQASGLSGAMLVLWISTVGADRINLLAGAGPLVLRPVLVLTGPLLLLEMFRLVRRGRAFRLPATTPWFFLLLTGFLSVLAVSILANVEAEYSVRRFALLTTESYAAFLVAIVLAMRPDGRTLLVRGAVGGLLLIILFNLVQILRWIGIYTGSWMDMGGIVNLDAGSYGPWLPRPSGVSIDPNRGGLLILFYVYVVAFLARPSASRSILVGLGCIALLLTLSRSAILAGVVVAVVVAVRRGIQPSQATIGYAALFTIPFIALLLVSTDAQEGVVNLGEILAGRFSLEEGSASQHLGVIERAWEVSSRSPKNLLLGIGFGNSFTVLQDFFPGTKYANFHSLYFTVLTEAGVAALMLVLILLAYPVVRGGWLQAYVVGMIVFSVFYQFHVEAAFWFVLATGWIALDRPADVDAPSTIMPTPEVVHGGAP